MAGWDLETGKKWPGMTPGELAKIAVLIPHRSEYDYRSWKEWWDMCPKPEGMIRLEERGYSLTTAREHLVEEALKRPEVTHLFFLDDDILPPDTIWQDLINANAPIACGVYMSRKSKAERGLAAWIRDPNHKGYHPIAHFQPMRYVSCDVTGLGCAMIHRWVFENTPKPWFYWDVKGPSEDFYFFEKVYAELGYKPIIDLGSQCRHIGTWAMDCTGEVDCCDL